MAMNTSYLLCIVVYGAWTAMHATALHIRPNPNHFQAVRTRSPLSQKNFKMVPEKQQTSPGEIRELPFSEVQRGRLEVAKTVVAFIVAFLAIKMKVDDWTGQYWPKREWKEGEELGPVQVLPDSKIRVQDWSRGEGVPQRGEVVRYDIRVLYNGLPIKTFNQGKRVVDLVYGEEESNSKIWRDLSLSGLAETNVLDGMQFGGRRKVVLPPAYAFGAQGFPPLVPIEANVLVEVLLLPPILSPQEKNNT